MSSTHPLELPEVLSHIAKFVPLSRLLTYALVSRTWSQAFIPYIWRNIRLDEKWPTLPWSFSSHSHHVKSLEIYCTPTSEHAAMRCPNLESLTLTGCRQNLFSLQLIMGHPTLTRLQMHQLWSNYQSEFWDKVLGFRHLKHLALSVVTFADDDVDKFWQLCTRMERLELSKLRLANHGNLSSMEFPLLKEFRVGIDQEEESTLYLELVKRCPSLTACNWKIGDREADKRFVSGFVDLVASKTWSDLDSVDSASNFITNEDLSKIMEGMTQISVLNIGSTWEAFGSNSTELLRPRFSNLKELSLGYCITAAGPLAQEIMSSCPMLEKLSIPHINASEIASGRPWVCLGLKKLSVRFCFRPATVGLLQPLVFEQLSRLKRLEDLRIDGISDDPTLRKMRLQETFDLRLCRGLGKLSTLRSLAVINFLDTDQRMGDEEVDWMIEHWTSLVEVNGTLNTSKQEFDEALRGRLEKHGVRTKAAERRISRHGDSPDFESDVESDYDESI
ncbi:MAG: hypothetical protein J3Q66DRAFT_352880 [Benniella sp.]|nr:MAG: hypothetical protein J3Q66DRAFT_352880 [Benniella sp.]